MSRPDAIGLLHTHDPARLLAPLTDAERVANMSAIVSQPVPRTLSRRVRPRAMVVAVVGCLVALSAGVGWAATEWTPLSIFERNPQGIVQDTPLWNQEVIPDSVTQGGGIAVPQIGTIGFWYGDARQGGWCGGFRLPRGAWLGDLHERFDAGGTVPGCMPRREQVNAASGESPVYVINGFDYIESDVDLLTEGGSFWRLYGGRISVPDAVRVVDRISGRSAPVEQGHLFALGIPYSNRIDIELHLVAVDAHGRVVADERTALTALPKAAATSGG